jgi:DNA repair protein RadA/Sms
MRTKMANHKIGKKAAQACTRCEARFPADKMQCPECGHWNVEEVVTNDNDGTILLSDVEEKEDRTQYIKTGPWDVAFCKAKEGIPTRSVTLLGGAPGAGKSTMSIQLCSAIAGTLDAGSEVLYIGAEEAKEDYKERAKRLALPHMNRIRMYPMGANGDLGAILLNRRPRGIVIDSLPGIATDPAHAEAICKNFKGYAVELDAPVIIIDHVTKDGDMAGFMAIQHHVDITMLMFPEDGSEVRRLTVLKNRYGSANFDTFLMMTDKGLIAHEFEEDEDE